MSVLRVLINILFLASTLAAQGDLAIAGKVVETAERTQPEAVSPFRLDNRQPDIARHSQYVANQIYLSPDTAAIRNIQASRPAFIEMQLPRSLGLGKLRAFRTNIFAGNYTLSTSSGQRQSGSHQLAFYHGIVENDPRSLVAITLVNSNIHILISRGHSNYRIHETDHGQYVFYDETDLKTTAAYGCMTDDPDPGELKPFDPSAPSRHTRTGNCVEIYFECDHESYLDNGSSIANTEAWVASLFNEVSILYANENVPLSISEIFVWDTADLYQDETSTSGALTAFKNHRNNTGFNGRLAHLLSTRGIGGGIAYVNVLCSNASNYAVSANLGTNIIPFPTYSWNVNVVAHELGHNFGSPHTHACAWNGNSTQVDDCGNVWLSNNGESTGSCFDPDNPIIPQDGSVMSYCHLNTGNGISFNVGFGPQPGDLIYSNYINASCNTGTCSAPVCAGLQNPENGATNVSVNTGISWESAPGADGYRLTIGTSPGNGNILNNQDVGAVTNYDPGQLPFSTPIYVSIVPYNIQGDANSCTEFTFTTEADIPPSCTSLLQPADGAIGVNPDQVLTWAEANGFTLGYKLRIGTQPGGSEILPETDLGDMTTFAPEALPALSDIYIGITPYGSQGDTEGCPEESFTTNDQLVYCGSTGQNVSYEWISELQVGAFQRPSGAQTYTNFTADTIELSAGIAHPVSITPGYGNAVYPEHYRIWIDLNRNGSFSDPGEEVFSAGPVSNTVTGNIQVDAANLPFTTRMRVSMNYDGFSSPCDTFQYGEVEDYSVQIVEAPACSNLVTNTALSGPGSFSEALGCVQPGDTISFSPVISFSMIDITQGSIPVDMPLTLYAEPGSQISIRGQQVDRLFDVSSSGVLQIEGLHLVAGTTISGSAIRNAGTTILKEVVIHPNDSPAPGSTLIQNTGQLEIRAGVSVLEN